MSDWQRAKGEDIVHPPLTHWEHIPPGKRPWPGAPAGPGEQVRNDFILLDNIMHGYAWQVERFEPSQKRSEPSPRKNSHSDLEARVEKLERDQRALRDEANEARSQVASLTIELQQLRDARLESVPLSVEPVHEWIKTHRSEYRAFRGEHVAIHPVEGIVAHGETLEEVWMAVEEAGISSEVLIDLVPTDAE